MDHIGKLIFNFILPNKERIYLVLKHQENAFKVTHYETTKKIEVYF